MSWQLSPAALAASRAIVSAGYDGGGPWNPSACATQPTSNAKALAASIRAAFPWVGTIGTVRCDPNGDQMSVHAVGRALDVMVTDTAKGAALASWLVENAAALGVQLVIRDGSVWQASLSEPRLRPYTGWNPHIDHVHVEILAGGSGVLGQLPTALALALGAGAVLTIAGVGWVIVRASRSRRPTRRRRLR